MKTNDRSITGLMKAVDNGAAQLPDFQRGWVWDDERIKALILSVIHSFPVGAAMFLEYGNESIHFKHKPIEGSKADPGIEPDELILDGQQRLTSLYNALYSKKPVHTKTDKGKEIDRYYYLDIEKVLDPNADDEKVVISVPATKQVMSDFGRKIETDLSTRQDEFRLKMFPLNIILDSGEEQGWQNEYYAYYKYDPAIIQQFTELFTKIILPTQKYIMPVIQLDKETPKEAVCQVFEYVHQILARFGQQIGLLGRERRMEKFAFVGDTVVHKQLVKSHILHHAGNVGVADTREIVAGLSLVLRPNADAAAWRIEIGDRQRSRAVERVNRVFRQVNGIHGVGGIPVIDQLADS